MEADVLPLNYSRFRQNYTSRNSQDEIWPGYAADHDRLLRTWRRCRIAVTRYPISSLRIVCFGSGQSLDQHAFPSTDS